MSGYCAIRVVLIPNDMACYYFSVHADVAWANAVLTSHVIRDLCRRGG